jgi:hypothetical protein
LGNKDLTIVPNPFENNLSLLLRTDKNEDCSIAIYNTSGNIVYSGTLVSSPGINRVDVPMYGKAPGLYFIKVKAGAKNMTLKVVKTR